MGYVERTPFVGQVSVVRCKLYTTYARYRGSMSLCAGVVIVCVDLEAPLYLAVDFWQHRPQSTKCKMLKKMYLLSVVRAGLGLRRFTGRGRGG